MLGQVHPKQRQWLPHYAKMPSKKGRKIQNYGPLQTKVHALVKDMLLSTRKKVYLGTKRIKFLYGQLKSTTRLRFGVLFWSGHDLLLIFSFVFDFSLMERVNLYVFLRELPNASSFVTRETDTEGQLDRQTRINNMNEMMCRQIKSGSNYPWGPWGIKSSH